jgi:hypothetical protein
VGQPGVTLRGNVGVHRRVPVFRRCRLFCCRRRLLFQGAAGRRPDLLTVRGGRMMAKFVESFLEEIEPEEEPLLSFTSLMGENMHHLSTAM